MKKFYLLLVALLPFAAFAQCPTDLVIGDQATLDNFVTNNPGCVNLPGDLTIEGADSANTAIHTANDTVDGLDLDLAADVVRMNVAAVATLIERDSDWLTPVLHMMMV